MTRRGLFARLFAAPVAVALGAKTLLGQNPKSAIVNVRQAFAPPPIPPMASAFAEYERLVRQQVTKSSEAIFKAHAKAIEHSGMFAEIKSPPPRQFFSDPVRLSDFYETG